MMMMMNKKYRTQGRIKVSTGLSVVAKMWAPDKLLQDTFRISLNRNKYKLISVAAFLLDFASVVARTHSLQFSTSRKF